MSRNKKNILLIVFLFTFSIIVGSILRYQKNRKLSIKTNQTFAFFEKFTDMSKVCDESDFLYEINEKKFVLTICGQYNFLQKGDTVLIKYSIEDPAVAEVVDFCYMQKHKGKGYCK